MPFIQEVHFRTDTISKEVETEYGTRTTTETVTIREIVQRFVPDPPKVDDLIERIEDPTNETTPLEEIVEEWAEDYELSIDTAALVSELEVNGVHPLTTSGIPTDQFVVSDPLGVLPPVGVEPTPLPEFLEDLPAGFGEAWDMIVGEALDPNSPIALASALSQDLQMPDGILGGQTASFETIMGALQDGTVSVEDVRAYLQDELQHWETVASRDFTDYIDYSGGIDNAALGVLTWIGAQVGQAFNGFSDPLDPLQGFAEEMVTTLTQTLDLLAPLPDEGPLTADQAVVAAHALAHGITATDIGTSFAEAITSYVGGDFMGDYFSGLRIAGDIAFTVGSFASMGSATLEAVNLRAGLLGLTAGGALEFSQQYGTGTLDLENWLLATAGRTVISASNGAGKLVGLAAASEGATLFAAHLQNPAIARFLATRIVGPAAASAVMASGQELANMLTNGLPTTPDQVRELLARLATATLTGTLPNPGELFAGQPWLGQMLGEGFQELAQDYTQAVLLGADPLAAMTASEAGLTFFTAMLVGGVGGDNDVINDQYAAQREAFTLELEAAGVDPLVVERFRQRHALLSAMAVNENGPDINPGQVEVLLDLASEYGELMVEGPDGLQAIDPDVLASALAMFALPHSSLGVANAQHLAQVFDAVRASDLDAAYTFVSSMTADEFELLATLWTDATTKGVPASLMTDAPIVPFEGLESMTADELLAHLEAAGTPVPPYLEGVLLHGFTGFDRVQQVGLAAGMTTVEIQKLFAIQLAHHPSHFPIGLMQAAGLRPDFDAMVDAGQLLPEDGAALEQLYDAMFALSSERGAMIAEAQSRVPPNLTPAELDAFMASANDVQAAVEGLPPELAVQLLSDDLAQFADPRGIGKWVNIGTGALARQGVSPITMADVLQESFARPAFQYAAYNLARDPNTTFIADSAPMLSTFGLTVENGDRGLIVGLDGEYGRLAAAIRDNPSVMSTLDVVASDSDQAIAEAFLNLEVDAATATELLTQIASTPDFTLGHPSIYGPAPGTPASVGPSSTLTITAPDGSTIEAAVRTESFETENGTGYRIGVYHPDTNELLGFAELYQQPSYEAPIQSVIEATTGIPPTDGEVWFSRVQVAEELRGQGVGSILSADLRATLEEIGGRHVTTYTLGAADGEDGATRLAASFEAQGYTPFTLFGQPSAFRDY